MISIKRALISVSDKTGLDEFVRGLHELGVEIISTGGTARRIESAGVPVKRVSDVTGMPEMLDGRVKTLHPAIHGALLGLRDNPGHIQQMQAQGIVPIDMVVVNLYPFEQTTAGKGVSYEAAIEQIDIGGPSMLRSAAKNARSVAVICSPVWYEAVLGEMRHNAGAVHEETCSQLAAEVFTRTAAYDQAIARYLRRGSQPEDPEQPVATLSCEFHRVQNLRYGENPHQQAAFYRDPESPSRGIAAARQLHGKELSFNNILDLDAALAVVADFNEPAACVVKHTNPCGTAVATDLCVAFERAHAGDALSAFGGIVGFNRPVDTQTAEAVSAAGFLECIIAPAYDSEALALLRQKKNVRLMELPQFGKRHSDVIPWDFKRVGGGMLVQEFDTAMVDRENVRVVTSRTPDDAQWRDLFFAWTVVKHVKSNAIVLAQGMQTVGIGAGQMSRVDSVIIAGRKAGERCKGAVLASDAFFPKADAIEQAAQAGITAVIQPGGSIRDEGVIAAADAAGISMVCTGMRHFRH